MHYHLTAKLTSHHSSAIPLVIENAINELGIETSVALALAIAFAHTV
jgi:hypothetical protein